MSSSDNNKNKPIPLSEVHKHCNADDLWLAIDGKVYDVTGFAQTHPGGVMVLTSVGGLDCTEAFRGYHPSWVAEKYLPSMQIGVVENYQPTPMRRDMQQIEKDMEKAGLYRTPVHKYVWYFSYLAAMLSASVWCVLYGQSMFAHFVGAVLLGFFWQQLSFVGHDFGHNSVTPQSFTDYLGGSIVCALYGVSGQWWKATHNVHHVVTNSVHYDCDVQYLPIFAVNSQLLNTFFSHYHKRVFEFGRWQRAILSQQHWLYFPVMALARFNLYIQSILFLLFAPASECRRRGSAIVCTAVFFTWFISLLRQLPDAKTVTMFLLVSHAITGIIHVQITLSHFSMETYEGRGIQLTDPDHFVKLQLLGSMNVDCPPVLDWFHGGLQFQVEHHLFPRLPRYNLRRAGQEFIQPFLRKHGVKLVEAPFLEAVWRVFDTLRQTAKVAWSLSDSEVAARSKLSMLANAEG